VFEEIDYFSDYLRYVH